MRNAVAFAICLLPMAGVAAPVPAHLMPRLDVQLRNNPSEHPLGNTYEITVRNTGTADLQLWTNRPYGFAAFLDFEIVNDKGDRVSRLYPWGSHGADGDPSVLRETIAAKKSHVVSLPLFTSVDDKRLLPGKYKVRVRFKYQDHDAVSEWIAVEVLESQIRTKHLILGP